jgi:hypothetical protein
MYDFLCKTEVEKLPAIEISNTGLVKVLDKEAVKSLLVYPNIEGDVKKIGFEESRKLL